MFRTHITDLSLSILTATLEVKRRALAPCSNVLSLLAPACAFCCGLAVTCPHLIPLLLELRSQLQHFSSLLVSHVGGQTRFPATAVLPLPCALAYAFPFPSLHNCDVWSRGEFEEDFRERKDPSGLLGFFFRLFESKRKAQRARCKERSWKLHPCRRETGTGLFHFSSSSSRV